MNSKNDPFNLWIFSKKYIYSSIFYNVYKRNYIVYNVSKYEYIHSALEEREKAMQMFTQE